MNSIRQSTSFILVLALSLLISACGGGPTASLSLVGDNNSGNNPGPISPSDLIPSNPPPPVPVITTAEATANSVLLKWTDESRRELGFIIVRDGIKIGETDKNISQYTDTTVLPATTYTYLVVAWNKEGEGVSPEQLVTTPPLPVPPKWILPEGANIRSFATNQVTGELYAAGMTTVALTDTPQNGREDEFLAKINSDGTIAWLKQWGTPYVDLVLGDFLAISNGNIYVLCNCNDASGLGGGDPQITVFNPQGDILRTVDLLGRSGTQSIVADDNGVYVVFSEDNVGQVIAKIDYQASDPIVWVTKSQEYVTHITLYGDAIYGVGRNAMKSYIAWFDRETGDTLNIAYHDERYFLDAIAADADGVYAIEAFFKLTVLKYPRDLAGVPLINNLPGSGQLYGAVPAQDDDSLYFAVSEAGLFRLDKSTLQIMWQRTDVKGSATALVGDVLLVASGNKFFRYDALTGESLP